MGTAALPCMMVLLVFTHIDARVSECRTSGKAAMTFTGV
jgi:hypothetical protein